MKAGWTKYLKSIGFKEPFMKRAEDVLGFYQRISPDQIENIFITDYIDKEGMRHYDNLWFFSPTTAMEAKNFLKEDDFDATPMKNLITYWSIEKREYDFTDATANSRMTLRVAMASSKAEMNMRASGANCDRLKMVFIKYILPNVA